MIKFFRTPWQSIMSFVGSEKLRLDIWTKNRFRRYLLYAIGEIMLIMIGILLALSVNNWNENRKSNATTVEIYHNLLQSLQQDSVEIRRIINFQKESLEVQKMLLTTNINDLAPGLDADSSSKLMYAVIKGSMSFFPKYGVFNSVVSENEMDLIHSNELKMSLINLYDYQYKRYENIDAIVDQKFQYDIFSIIDRKMMNYTEPSSTNSIIPSKRINPNLLERYYPELKDAIKGINRVMVTGYWLLLEIQASIHETAGIIRRELQQ